MASAETTSQKLRILLMPFFVTSHIGPFTDLAVGLAVAGAGAVEPTVAVTTANVTVVRSALERHGPAASGLVKVATYPFPRVDGLAPGVENLSAAGDDAWRIDAAAINEALTRPPQEAIVRERSPDAVVTDFHFFWNSIVAADLGVPCVTFAVASPFSALTMGRLTAAVMNDPESREVTLRESPWPEIRIPVTEMPEFLSCQDRVGEFNPCVEALGRCFGQVTNTFLELEQPYCELLVREGHGKRGYYFVGPLSPPSSPPAGVSTAVDVEPCFRWLASKPSCSVVYICFGSFAAISEDQLRELALGLEASGQPFLWAVRAGGWAPLDGWEERVGEKGMLVRGWASQTAILAHPAVGAFLSHCGANSVRESVTAGVPMLTWPLVFEQFLEERLVTEVLKIGERVWNGPRSTRYLEREVVPAEAVASFLEPGGAGEAARGRARELAAKARAAAAEGGSSFRDLRRLVDDLVQAKRAAGRLSIASSNDVGSL